MKVKMLTLQAGPNGVREAGRIYDVPEAEARQLIEGRYAVEVSRQEPVERAVRVAPSRRKRTFDEPAKDEAEGKS